MIQIIIYKSIIFKDESDSGAAAAALLTTKIYGSDNGH